MDPLGTYHHTCILRSPGGLAPPMAREPKNHGRVKLPMTSLGSMVLCTWVKKLLKVRLEINPHSSFLVSLVKDV